MQPSTDQARAALQSAEAAFLEKVEELSFLRSLNDRLARVPDFTSACRALVDLVWEERGAAAVAYVSLDRQRKLCRVEAVAPELLSHAVTSEFGVDVPPFNALSGDSEVAVLPDVPPPAWLVGGKSPAAARATASLPERGTVIGAAMRVRGTTTGALLVFSDARRERVEEDRRLLAVVATSAALALDVARSEAREEFLAMLRHDINTPVSIALGYAELVVERLQSQGDEQLVPLAVSVVESLKAVGDLVSNYLHMAAIDRGVHWLHFQEADLAALTADVVDRLRASASEKQVALTFTAIPAPVRADRRQLERVITNLVSNAIKYTPGPGRVDVTISVDATAATLEVKDTGYGMSDEDLKHVFTKYGRFHRQKGIPGTGLGLFLSKAIVDAHSGAIAVASAPDQGSTFTVRIPRASA
jgi:signal transduction histidine kinase